MVIQLFFLIISLYAYSLAPLTMDMLFMATMIIVALLSIIFNYYTKNSGIKKQYLRHSVLFVISYIVVFYQYNIDYVLGFVEVNERTSLIWYDTTVVCKSLAMANIGLSSFMIGFQLFNKIGRWNITAHHVYIYRNSKIIVNCIYVLIILYLIFVEKDYLINGYPNHIEQGNIAYHLSIYIQGLLFSAFVINSCKLRSCNIKTSVSKYLRINKTLLLAVFLWVTLILLSGRRTEAIKDILLVLISFIYVCQYKFGIRELLIPIIGLSVLMGVMALTRVEGTMTMDEAIKALQGSVSISPLTQELAFNVSSLHIALSNIPENIGYNYGITFVLGFLVIVPGLQPFVINALSIPDVLKGSAWLITEISNVDFGMGTSVIADIYVSFGIWGVIPIMVLWGILLSFMEKSTFGYKVTNPYIIAFSFSIYTTLIYVVRSSLVSVLDSISYTLIFIFLFSKRKKVCL
jgi:oligosaccharide repeat unit polymerase